MPVTGNRALTLGLGINLGWIQQGAAFGGRPTHELAADLVRIRDTAAAAGYSGFQGYVDAAHKKLSAGQPPANIVPEINALIGVFQGGASGHAAAALNLGICLGWLQQGARAGNRPAPQAAADLSAVKQHAALAGYQGFEAYADAALAKLGSGQPVGAILADVTALIGLFQGQS